MKWDEIKHIISPGVTTRFDHANGTSDHVVVLNVSRNGGYVCKSQEKPINFTCFYYDVPGEIPIYCADFLDKKLENVTFRVLEHPETLIHPYTEN